METTLLNKAHEAGRRATKLIRKGNFDAAVDCHLEAARLLQDLQQRLSDDSPVLRSLDEQASYHKRQAELAHIRRKAFECLSARMKSMDATRNSSESSVSGLTSLRKTNQNVQEPRVAHHEILKTFDEADSLLQILSERKYNPPSAKFQDKDNKFQVSDTVTYHHKPVFTIRPKNDADVIEELQMVNANLRNLVDRLLGELHEVRQENMDLKKRLESCEDTSCNSSSFQLEVDKLKGTFLENYKPRELPELAPLETPDFDFSDFSQL